MWHGTSGSGPRRAGHLLLATVAVLAFAAPARAAGATAEQAAPVAASTRELAAPADQPAETAPADALFTTEELRKLLAPIALYPDALLAQLLPATAYPVDIVLAARWLDKNEAAVKKGDFSGADAQGWDPSVKALARFPDIIRTLNTDLDATSDLGDAFVNQPDDVAAVIQDLRREAQKAGSLKSTPQQTVTVQQQVGAGTVVNDYVVIEPADPGVIYVPTYDPATVYYEDNSNVAASVIGFGVGIAVGVAIDNAWDWGHGWVYPPRWPGYPGYRPGYGGGINNGNINIGNDINIGAGNTRPWRPDPGKYHPGQGSKPGLATRPGGIDRAGGAGRQGGGSLADRPNAGNRAAGVDRAGAIGNAKPGSRPNGGDLAGKKAGAGAAVSGKGDGIKNAAAAKGGKPAGAKASVGQAAKQKKPAGGVQKPAQAANRPKTQRPANNTAFSGASFGGASGAMANRGAASRQSVARPAGGNRSFSGGGGGRPPMARGSGGGGRGGGRR